jgi:hypothetical protein
MLTRLGVDFVLLSTFQNWKRRLRFWAFDDAALRFAG